MEFEYTLQRDEYMNCCKYEYFADKDVQKLRRRALPVGPVILIFALILLRSTYWLVYVAAVILALLWVLVVNRMVARIIVTGAKKKCDSVGDEAFRPIHLVLGEGSLKVNNSKQTLKSYRSFTNLILLFLENGSTIALPARVIGGEDEEHIKPVVNALERCMRK